MIGEGATLVGHGGNPEGVSEATPPLLLRPKRENIGAELDRLIRVLPSGAARNFARGLPRRIDHFELLACLEALVRMIQAEGEDRP
jgi:hypothetical protein